MTNDLEQYNIDPNERTINSDMLKGYVLNTPFGDFVCAECVIYQQNDWLLNTGYHNIRYVIHVYQVGEVTYDTETPFGCQSQPPMVREECGRLVHYGPVLYISNARMVVYGEETLDMGDLENLLDYISQNAYIVTDNVLVVYT